jgi:hypothetical protein
MDLPEPISVRTLKRRVESLDRLLATRRFNHPSKDGVDTRHSVSYQLGGNALKAKITTRCVGGQ